VGAPAKQKRRRSRHNLTESRERNNVNKSDYLDSIVDETISENEGKSDVSRKNGGHKKAILKTSGTLNYYSKISSAFPTINGLKPDFDSLSDFYFPGLKKLSSTQISQLELLSTWEFHHLRNHVKIKNLDHVPEGKKDMGTAIVYLKLKSSRKEYLYEEVLNDIIYFANKHSISFDDANTINSLFYKITQTGASIPKIAANPLGEIKSAKSIGELVDVLTHINHINKISSIIRKPEHNEDYPDKKVNASFYSTYMIPETDIELIRSAQDLRDNIEMFVHIWQKIGCDPSLRDALPSYIRLNLMDACEHLIRCLKANVVDIRTLRGVTNALGKTLKFIADRASTAAITAVVTAAVVSRPAGEKAPNFTDVCNNAISISRKIEDELNHRWENNSQTDYGFDFGTHVD
jgi:hypothetical protein